MLDFGIGIARKIDSNFESTSSAGTLAKIEPTKLDFLQIATNGLELDDLN
jgi:hypothetical protein